MSTRRILFLGILLILGLAVIGFQAVNSPLGEPSRRQVIEIPHGASLHEISQLLHENKFIANEWFFTMLARVTGQDRRVIPGEYEFDSGMRPSEILVTNGGWWSVLSLCHYSRRLYGFTNRRFIGSKKPNRSNRISEVNS